MESANTRPITGGQSPEQLAVALEPPRVRNAIRVLCERRAARILEIVDPFAPHVIVGDAAKVDPAMRVLMTEQRREMDEALAVTRFPLVTARPFPPATRREWIRGRTEAEQVEDHPLVVANPAVLDESAFRTPAHRKRARPSRAGDRERAPRVCIAVPLLGGVRGGFSSRVSIGPARHPMPVDSIVNLIYEIANGRFIGIRAAEIFPRVERAGEKERGVDGRQLTLPSAQARVHVQEMVKPAFVTNIALNIRALGLFMERLQRLQNPFATLLARDPTVVNADTNGRQPKTDRGDAAIRVGSGTVADQAVCRVGFEPEVIECLSLKELEKVDVACELIRRDGRRLGHCSQQKGEAKRNRNRANHAATLDFGPYCVKAEGRLSSAAGGVFKNSSRRPKEADFGTKNTSASLPRRLRRLRRFLEPLPGISPPPFLLLLIAEPC